MVSQLKLWQFRITALLTIWLSMAMLWNSGRLANGPVLCWFRALTGHPCPFCGSTRAVGALCAGNFAAAWKLNPFGVIMFIAFCAYLLKPSLAKTLNRHLSVLADKLGPALATTSVATLFAATWAWDIATRW
ncbi:MAG: DUF2752 domain-containing protein [Actinobacteria bacterium]|nr:DUF2752 domain-containing protein [Actinomycetota bacterium]